VAAAARIADDPGVRVLPLLAVLVAPGCLPAEELRLTLAAVTPDPLEGATTLRIWFDPGAGVPVAEDIDLAADEPGGGLRGEAIADIRLEAFDAQGAVVARGNLPGDHTPGPGEIREETVALLRAGEFSVFDELQLDSSRERACAVAVGDGRVLIAGGGETSTEWLDVGGATLTPSGSGLSGDRVGCHAALLNDGSVLLASLGDHALDLLSGQTGTLVEALDTDRSDGALATLADGEAAWWLGGTEDDVDLTSELLESGSNQLQTGPTWAGGARAGHAAACSADGAHCAVFGSDAGARGWWHVDSGDVLSATAGLGLDSVKDLDDQLLEGAGIAGVALDADHVLAQTEDTATHLYVLDMGLDGVIDKEQQLPNDVLGCVAVRSGSGAAWIIGGAEGGSVSSAVREMVQEDEAWSEAAETMALHDARSHATAALLADGRIVVVGGVDEAGEPVPSIEVFQP